jgi:hypothetical protein
VHVDPSSQTDNSQLWHKTTNHKIPVGSKVLTSLPFMPCDFPTGIFQTEEGKPVLMSVSRFFLTYVWVICMTAKSEYFARIIFRVKFIQNSLLVSLCISTVLSPLWNLLTATGYWRRFISIIRLERELGSCVGLGAVEKMVIFWPSVCRFLGRQYVGLVALLTGLSSSLNELLLLAVFNL